MSEISGFTFFSKMTRRICAKFISGFRRKHLCITTCIENCKLHLAFNYNQFL